jgi:hypothetical protein
MFAFTTESPLQYQFKSGAVLGDMVPARARIMHTQGTPHAQTTCKHRTQKAHESTHTQIYLSPERASSIGVVKTSDDSFSTIYIARSESLYFSKPVAVENTSKVYFFNHGVLDTLGEALVEEKETIAYTAGGISLLSAVLLSACLLSAVCCLLSAVC